jgi:hypothetical protein
MSNMFGSRLDSQEISSYFWILTALIMRLRILDVREWTEDKMQGKEAVESNSQEKLDACWREN